MTKFKSAYMKVERSQQHIDELKKTLQDYKNSSFCEMGINETGLVVSVVITKAIPDTVALCLGDAFHNLRSSLDHVAYEIVSMHDGSLDRIQFPIADTEVSLKKNGYFGLEAIYPEFAKHIADVVKPYEKGNYKLWALNKLNNLDKHRLLLSYGQGTSAGIEGLYEDGTPFGVQVANIRDVIGESNSITVSKRIVAITKFIMPTPQLFMGKNGYYDGHLIEQMYDEIKAEVLSTIATLEKF